MQIKIENIENFTDYENLDYSNIKWVEPIFISMLKAYITDKNIKIDFNHSYINNMMSLQFKKDSTFSPIEHIEIFSRNNINKISNHLTEIMLKNFPSLDTKDKNDLKKYLNYLFSELMNNVSDHSRSEIGGYAMAQYYPTNHKIQFAIADRGIGFLNNIKLAFPNIDTEGQAIEKALEKGITATPARVYGDTTKNAGFGLYAMQKILQETGGSFVIISNDTLYRYKNGKISFSKLKKPWQGVAVAFEFYEKEINLDLEQILWAEDLEEYDEDFF